MISGITGKRIIHDVREDKVPVKGKLMENQIVCPHCQKTISNNSIIDDASKGEGSDAQSILCECGERITYWQITAQLRDQKSVSQRFQNWARTRIHSRS